MSINLIHWVLAHRYHQSTVEIPFVINMKPIPKRMKVLNTAFFWSVTLLICTCALFVFFEETQRTLYKTLFIVSSCLVVLTSLTMWISLYRMKKTIDTMPRLKKDLNVGRMFNHSLAFFLYVSMYVAFTIINMFQLNNAYAKDFYASWLVMSIAGLAL